MTTARTSAARTSAATRAALRACAVLGALALPAPAWTHEGHDDESPAVAVATATAAGSARFVATSDRFELVGVLDGRTLTLYLDRFADNAPVPGARLELDVGDERLVARAVDDRYVAHLSAAPAAGTIPVMVTVAAGDATDLLAADLEVRGPSPVAAAPAPAAAMRTAWWRAAATWPGVAVAVGAGVFIALRRLVASSRSRN